MEQIIQYQDDKVKFSDYINLVKSKYRNDVNFDYFFLSLKVAFQFACKKDTTFIAIYQNDQMIAHVGITICNNNEAIWGFFESTDDEFMFNLMWDQIIKFAYTRQVKKISGPINGSIWHQYRWVSRTDNTPWFRSELICEPYYYNLIKNHDGLQERQYYSAYRKQFNNLIQVTQQAYDDAVSDGYSVIDTTDLDDILFNRLVEIAKSVFSNNWNYEDLSDSEILNLFSDNDPKNDLSQIYLLKKESTIIGYCTVFTENSSTLVVKTIAILPQFQNKGLGNAFIHKIHVDAQDLGVQKLIYALIYNENNIKHLPQDDAVIFRHYSAFELCF